MKRMSYMTGRDLIELCSAQTVQEVVSIAIVVIGRMPKPRRWVAGPVTSGTRHPHENRRRLHSVILHYKEQGLTTINYLPFQKRALKIITNEVAGKKHPSLMDHFRIQERLRDEFYAPIFMSGCVEELRIMPGSQASLNVHWMRDFAVAKKIPVRFIPVEVLAVILKGSQ